MGPPVDVSTGRGPLVNRVAMEVHPREQLVKRVVYHALDRLSQSVNEMEHSCRCEVVQFSNVSPLERCGGPLDRLAV